MSATLASLRQLDDVSPARDGNQRDIAPDGVSQEVCEVEQITESDCVSELAYASRQTCSGHSDMVACSCFVFQSTMQCVSESVTCTQMIMKVSLTRF